jgi:hypothetical protein
MKMSNIPMKERQPSNEEHVDRWHEVYKNRYKVMHLRSPNDLNPSGEDFFIYDYHVFDLVKKGNLYIRFEKQSEANRVKELLTTAWLPVLAKKMEERKRLGR